MKYKNKEELKQRAINLYTDGKTYIEISKVIGCSRNYVSELIRNDSRVLAYKNKKILKLYKRLNKSKISIPISLDFWDKIGISKNPNISEEVEIIVDEKERTILIKKH